MHTPLVAYAITPFLSLLEPMPAFHLVAFILLPLIIIGFCIISGFLLRLVVPKIYSTLTGGRGL
jgi:hypothetical protein